MNRTGDRPAAAERARWLAELAAAIDSAQDLARTLNGVRGRCAEAEHFFGRLEVIRIEVEDLRRGGWRAAGRPVHPSWSSLFPWPGTIKP